MSRRWIGAVAATALLAGCGATSSPPSAVVSNPVAQGSSRPSASASPTAALPSVLTVLSPLGLNIRSGPSRTAARIGTAAQGVVLTVVSHDAQNGGWYEVHGQTVTGWVTADPSLTAPGQFIAYQSSDGGFNALYPQTWTFAASATDVVFHPLSGAQTIVVRTGPHVASFGAVGGPGFVGSGQQAVVVCGVTGNLDTFSHFGTSPPPPPPGTPGPLALLAQLRLRLDATHALAMDFNYSTAADLDAFNAFYNSMTFPFPQCERVAPPAATP